MTFRIQQVVRRYEKCFPVINPLHTYRKEIFSHGGFIAQKIELIHLLKAEPIIEAFCMISVTVLHFQYLSIRFYPD